MVAEPENKTPPYTSFTTFNNFINGLKETDLPNQIDNSLIQNLSGSAQSSLLGALRYLKLVREDKAPTEEFRTLILASDKERPATLKGIVERAYPFLKGGKLDLAKATPQQLAEVMRDLGASGGTLPKSIAFFLAAAKASGITVSPHILKRKHVTGSSGQKRNKTSGNDKPPGTETPSITNKNKKSKNRADRGPEETDLRTQLLNKFPEFDTNWPDPIKTKWFESFERLMNSAGLDSKN